MSRIVRRDMLKAMAATAAGAAVSGTGIESVLAAAPSVSSGKGLPRTDTAPKVAFTTSPGVTYEWLWGTTDFHPEASTEVFARTNIYADQASSLLWARCDVPQGALISEVWVSLIVNDTNTAVVQLGQMFPWANTAPVLAELDVSTQSAAIQNLQMTISSPIAVSNSQWMPILVYIPGTSNSATHQLLGARIGWVNNPGLTLFPNPRRIVSGDATPFTAGVTYGPLDATHTFSGPVSGIPVGATAAFCAVQSYTAGVLTVFPDLAADPGIANYGATATGPLNMTYMMVPLSAAGKFKIHSYLTGRVYVDAWGYVV